MSDNEIIKNNSLLFNKIFFGKSTALKLQYNQKLNQIYIHTGKKRDDKNWCWLRTKLGDLEISKILRVFSNKIEKVSFYHEYKGKKQQIWINKDKDVVFFRIGDISKSLDLDEQTVMSILLKEIIIESNKIKEVQ